MIPLKLRLQGFLSYHQAVELDFSSFDLACISGANGAGKSSLLDAITWALFGRARKANDDALINSSADMAEVTFEFHFIRRPQLKIGAKVPEGETLLGKTAPEQLDFYWKNLGLSEPEIKELKPLAAEIMAAAQSGIAYESESE